MAATENRAERLARNQALFREINERLAALLSERDGTLSQEAFLCECVHEGCVDHIAITLDEYRQVRATPLTFAVFPNKAHVVQDIERIVAVKTGYWIVEKQGAAAEVVEEEAEQRVGSIRRLAKVWRSMPAETGRWPSRSGPPSSPPGRQATSCGNCPSRTTGSRLGRGSAPGRSTATCGRGR
jgi:hypothetical protein